MGSISQIVDSLFNNNAGAAVSGGDPQGRLYRALYGHPLDPQPAPPVAPQTAPQGWPATTPAPDLSRAYTDAMAGADSQVAQAQAAAQAPIIAAQQEAERRAQLAAQDPTNQQSLLKQRRGSSPGAVTLAISPQGRALQSLGYGNFSQVAPEHPQTYWEKHPEVQNTATASPQFETLLDRKLNKVRDEVLQRLEEKRKGSK